MIAFNWLKFVSLKIKERGKKNIYGTNSEFHSWNSISFSLYIVFLHATMRQAIWNIFPLHNYIFNWLYEHISIGRNQKKPYQHMENLASLLFSLHHGLLLRSLEQSCINYIINKNQSRINCSPYFTFFNEMLFMCVCVILSTTYVLY